MLERNGIEKNVITKTPEIVYINDTKEIENIINKIKGYGISKEEINNAPEILTYDEVSVNKLLRKLEFVTAYDDIFKNVITNAFKEIVTANMQNLIDFVEEIEKGNLDRNIIELNPEIISKTTPIKVEETIKNLKSLGMEEYYIKNKQILLISEPQKILDIVKTFEELNIDKEILENPIIFLEGDSENIYNIVSEIDKRKMSRDILKNTFILIKGEYDNISKILEKLENEHVDLSTDIINKSTTILSESTPEDLDEVKKFLESKKLLNNPEVDIPGILFAKGKKENMEKVYNFFEANGLLNELKGAMSLLCRPILNIEKNFDLVIENGMVNELLNNISVLGLGSETIEKRLKYLEKIGEDKTILALKMTGDKFNKRYDATDAKLDAAIEDEYYAQNIIESRFSEYLEREERELKNFREERFFESILENILELGIVRKKFEYYKCGYSYSMIKIKQNLNKLITYAVEDLGIENISAKDKIYIIVLSILGNKKVSEKEAEEVCRSIIKKEKEAEINPQLVEKDVHKISVGIEKNVLEENYNEEYKEEANYDINNDSIENDSLGFEDEYEEEEKEHENNNQEIAELEEKEAAQEKVENDILTEEDFEDIDNIEEFTKVEEKYSEEDYNKDLEELGIEEEKSLNDTEIKSNNTKSIRQLINNTNSAEKEILPENIEKNNEISNSLNNNKKDNNNTSKIKEEELNKTEETIDKYKIDIEELKREREEQKKYQENEMLRLRKQLDDMKASILNFKKEAEERRIEEQERKYREEKEELSKIIQRRQEKELEELRKRNEELEQERKRRQEEDIQRKIAEEAERITREEILKLQEELKQKEKIQKEYEEKVREDAKRAIQEAIEIEKIKLSKKPVIDLSREIEKNEDVIREEIIKEENVAEEYDEISELTGNIKNDSIDAYIMSNNMNNVSNIIDENDNISSFEDIDEITGKRIIPNRNIKENINNNHEFQNQNMNNFGIDNASINPNISVNTQNNMNNINTQPNLNMQQQAYNRNNFGNSEEFNRTIDAYYNPNKKPFFNLDDYGYILNAVNEEEQKRIQTEMNELYKRKKNNYYDA